MSCSRPASRFALTLAPTLALAAATGLAQTDWQPLFAVNASRGEHAMAFDAVRGVTVAFGGLRRNASTRTELLLAGTELWDGERWRAANPPIEPPARRGPAMAFDLARGRVVLFGGSNGNDFGDTWEWDGVNWTQRTPALAPTPRVYTAMAYDVARQRTVLFGGIAAGVLQGDTWEWDGINWTPRSPASSPPARSGHAAAYDLLRGRTVVFGGAANDVWEWDGASWSNATPAVAPPPRVLHAMAFDLNAHKTLMFGGQDVTAATPPGELLSWDGTNWQNLTATMRLQPPAPSGCAMAYDMLRARTVLFGGHDAAGSSSAATFEWDGAQWTTLSPPMLAGSAIALDPTGSGILFGGSIQVSSATTSGLDTWQWRNGAWSLLQTATRPPIRSWPAMAFDSARQRAVLFGGMSNNALASLADTWLWDGAQWSAPPLGVSPPPRFQHAMTFDSVRQEVVLFGGMAFNSSGSVVVFFQDTWTWNGTAWQQRTPASQPSARRGAGLAFDRVRGRAVLFGGIDSSHPWVDTREWDGANWLLQSPLHSPPAAVQTSLAFDEARRRCVLALDEPWEWDGVDWIARTAPTPLMGTRSGLAAYDARTARVLRLGGFDGITSVAAIQSYGPVNPATLAPFGTACAGSAGAPLLRADDNALPWLGDVLTLAVAPVPPNAPVLLALGFSRTTFGGAALPASLDPIGMTGCTLLVSIDEALLAFANGARAGFALTVPTTTSLVGLQFFAQAAVADALANPAGIVASNGLEGRLGSK